MKAFIFIVLLVFLFAPVHINAQTCCSGGVPVSTNIGLPLADAGTFHIGISYDLNTLNTLKNGADILVDATRKRQTQSILLELGYSITDRLSFDILTSHVTQKRDISVNNFNDSDVTNGIGDMVLLAKYQVINSDNLSWSIGAGPKIAIGASDLKDDRGLTLVADLQPGSGAMDWLIWSQLTFPIKYRPTMSGSFALVSSFKGQNDDYLGVQTYQFGDETQLSIGVADQLLIGSQLLDPSVVLRYRKANVDEVDAFVLPNTGGEWLFVSPSISAPISPKVQASISIDIPLVANVVGTQLSPTSRWNIGAYIQLSKTKIEPLN